MYMAPLMGIVMLLAIACIGEKGVAPSEASPTTTLGTITLSPLNVVMAVGDTVRVSPIGVTLSGAPVTSYDSVLYVFSDPNDSLRVSVSSTGLVTGLTPSNSPVLLNVVAFKGGYAAANQAILQITATKFSGAVLSVQPVPPDSAKLAGGENKFIVPLIWNPTTGETVDNPQIRFAFTKTECQYVACYQPQIPAVGALTSDQLTLDDNGQPRYTRLDQFTPLGKPGTVWVRAEVLVYGVMLRDSVQYTLTYTLNNEVDLDTRGLSGSSNLRGGTYIAPGGNVLFYNNVSPSLGATVSVEFDDPSAALAIDPPSDVGGASGNITPMESYTYTQRLFVTPGTYHWTATINGSVPPYAGAKIYGVIYVE